MEKERVTNKQAEKKTNPLISSLISVGGGKGGSGGGIAGLVLFGGALAAAGYIAVASFARNKNHKAKGKGKDTHDQHQLRNRTKSQELLLDECGCKGEEDHALHSLLQYSKPQDVDAACDQISVKSTNQVSPSDLLSAQTLILEEKTDHKPNSEEENPTSFYDQEIALSDHSHPESAASSNENGVEDYLASLFNSPNKVGKVQELEIYEPQDGLNSIETESEDDSDIIDNDDDHGVLGSGEEDSSIETGSNSLDYNEEPVWPSELIKEPQQEFKGGYCDDHQVCSDSDAVGSNYAEYEKAMKVTNDATLNKKANSSLVVKQDLPSVLRTLVIPVLLLALMLFLVLLTREGSSVSVP